MKVKGEIDHCFTYEGEMGDKSLTLPMKVNGEVDQRFTYEGEWEVDQRFTYEDEWGGRSALYLCR